MGENRFSRDAAYVTLKRLSIAWPTLEATDMGDLISFLNDRK